MKRIGVVDTMFVDKKWVRDEAFIEKKWKMSVEPGAWEATAAARFKVAIGSPPSATSNINTPS